MDIFLDTADIGDIRQFGPSGLVSGVTTNPSLIRKSGREIATVLREICDEVAGPVSAEVTATDAAGMLDEGRRLREISDHIVVKVPLTWDGLQACRTLAGENHPVNVTLCFSAAQALLAAKANATYISPFLGRLDDIGADGVSLVAEIREIYDRQSLETRILAASVRSPMHVAAVAAVGADVATLPPGVLRALAHHPLTDQGLAQFLADWEATGQTI